ncbi:MAG: diguanylate cyclase [Planctomycetes bacterium]|nr:diguanylate cyclase [Planctomycetota bacterium]
MAESIRTVRIVTADESMLASTRAAASGLAGWQFAHVRAVEELVEKPPAPGDVILLDGNLRPNVYEACRRLTGKTRCRTYVIVEKSNTWAEPIAHFCGATGVLARPVSAQDVRAALEKSVGPRSALPTDTRGAAHEPNFPEKLLRDLTGAINKSLVVALTDPETNLFNYAFLNYKLDEEFKRAQRFGHPLACVMLGFEGQASEEVLRQLSGIFLSSARDTDVLGRFDENSFLFLLPNSGPDGAQVMAKRVGQAAEDLKLRDLVGDPLQISVGISFSPHPEVKKREDLFSLARRSFLAAQQAGGGVVTTP